MWVYGRTAFPLRRPLSRPKREYAECVGFDDMVIRSSQYCLDYHCGITSISGYGIETKAPGQVSLCLLEEDSD